MLSITGLTLEQFADLMGGLGYKAERGERPKVKAAPEPAAGTGGDGRAGNRGRNARLGMRRQRAGRGRHARSDAAGGARRTLPGERRTCRRRKRPPTCRPRRRRRRRRKCRATRPPRAGGVATETEVFYTFTWAPSRRGGDRPQRRAEGGAGKPRGERPKDGGGKQRGKGGKPRWQGRQGPPKTGRDLHRPPGEARQGRSRQPLRGAGRAQGQVLNEAASRPTGWTGGCGMRGSSRRGRFAAKIVSGGAVRVNGTRASKPRRASVGPGDVLTFAQARAIRVIRIVGVGCGGARRPRRRRSTTISILRAAPRTGARPARRPASHEEGASRLDDLRDPGA
jgi:ribosomal 50S subunit-recycling heat shock protein